MVMIVARARHHVKSGRGGFFEIFFLSSVAKVVHGVIAGLYQGQAGCVMSYLRCHVVMACYGFASDCRTSFFPEMRSLGRGYTEEENDEGNDGRGPRCHRRAAPLRHRR